MSKTSATRLSTLCLLLLMTVALSLTAGAAPTPQVTQTTSTQPPTPTVKIPTGSYMLNCRTCQFSGTDYSCKCKVYGFDSNVPSYTYTTKIDLTTCTVNSSGFYDLSYTMTGNNSTGRLYCTGS